MAKLTRRNTIIGLGALVGGTGALAASGAFTTVEAERQFEVDTAGDAEALVAIDILNEVLEGTQDGDVVEFDIEDLNLRAVTGFNQALFIGNNSENTISLDIQRDSTDGTSLIDGSPTYAVQFDATNNTSDLSNNDLPDGFGTGDVTESYSSVDSDRGVIFNLNIDLLDEGVEIGQDASHPIDSNSDASNALSEAVPNDVIVIEANQQ